MMAILTIIVRKIIFDCNISYNKILIDFLMPLR